jgi:hypothetical protein
MAIEREFIKENLAHYHLPHVHYHHPHNQQLSNWNSSNGGDSSDGGIGAALAASMAAHPIGWAIGAIVVIGAVAYFALKDD